MSTSPPLSDVETPALILDSNRLDRNVARMRDKVGALGVTLRPHMKTAKSADVARRVLPEGGGPITVSTLREAEYFAAHGFNDVFYAVALAPQKLDRAIRLVRNGTRLLLAVDDSSIAAVIDQGGRRSRTQLKVMIEIDSGEHRSGVAADSPALLEMPRPWVQTHGLLASSHTAVIRIRAARQMSKPRWPSRSGPQ